MKWLMFQVCVAKALTAVGRLLVRNWPVVLLVVLMFAVFSG